MKWEGGRLRSDSTLRERGEIGLNLPYREQRIERDNITFDRCPANRRLGRRNTQSQSFELAKPAEPCWRQLYQVVAPAKETQVAQEFSSFLRFGRAQRQGSEHYNSKSSSGFKTQRPYTSAARGRLTFPPPHHAPGAKHDSTRPGPPPIKGGGTANPRGLGLAGRADLFSKKYGLRSVPPKKPKPA
jgi:hypothetical protein